MVDFENANDYADRIKAKILDEIPVLESELPLYLKSFTDVKLQKQEADLSFSVFWNLYGYKVGKKDRCEKLWHNMNEQERSICLHKVKLYKQWQAQKSIDMAYPETFLSQRRWDNEFKL